MSKNFMYANLSRMTSLPKCAVMCRNNEELEAFYENAKRQLGKFLCWDFDEILNLWCRYREITGFTLFVSDSEPGSMSYCDEDWFRRSGYELIEFSDLCDVADIEESDQPVAVLFGGVC